MPIQLEHFSIFKNGLLLKHSKSGPFLLLTSIEGYYFSAFPAAEGPLVLYTSLLLRDALTHTRIHLNMGNKKDGETHPL